MKLLWIIFFTLLQLSVYAQNDRQADSVPQYHNVRINANGSLNITPTDKVYLLNNQLVYSFEKDKVELNSNAKWIYGHNTAGLTNNDFVGLIDGNYFHDKEKRFNSWILGSYTSSYSLNILSEYQTGLGVSYKFFDIKKNNVLNLKISNGFIWEESNFLNPEGIQNNYSIIRNSLRVQMKLLMLNKRISLESTTFWQPAINKANDYNLRTVVVLNVPVWKFVSLQARYEYNFITRTERENTLLNYGITAQFRF